MLTIFVSPRIYITHLFVKAPPILHSTSFLIIATEIQTCFMERGENSHHCLEESLLKHELWYFLPSSSLALGYWASLEFPCIWTLSWTVVGNTLRLGRRHLVLKDSQFCRERMETQSGELLLVFSTCAYEIQGEQIPWKWAKRPPGRWAMEDNQNIKVENKCSKIGSVMDEKVLFPLWYLKNGGRREGSHWLFVLSIIKQKHSLRN